MTHMPTTHPQTIGEFPRPDGFAVARALEHAGINTTVLIVDGDRCRVMVAAEHVERAHAIV